MDERATLALLEVTIVLVDTMLREDKARGMCLGLVPYFELASLGLQARFIDRFEQPDSLRHQKM